MGDHANTLHQASVWVYLCVLGFIATAVWMSGSTDFRFSQHVLDSNESANFLRDKQAWELSGEPSLSGISPQGIDIGLTIPGRARAVYSQDLGSDYLPLDVASDSNLYLLVSATIERKSESEFYQSIPSRPTLVVRLITDVGDLRSGVVLRTDGTDEKMEFSRFIPIGPDSTKVEVFWQLHAVAQWRLSSLWVTPVGVSKHYLMGRKIITVCLLGLVLIAAIHILFRLHLLISVLLFSVVGSTLALTTMAQHYFNAVIDALFQLLFSYSIEQLSIEMVNVQKIGHVIAFAVLTSALLGLSKSLRLTVLQVFCSVLLFAWLTEALQRHIATRSSSLLDVGIDSVGILLGFALYIIVVGTRISLSRI